MTDSTTHRYRRRITREWLRQRYWVDRAPVARIAAAVGCSISTVYRWLDRHGLGRRDDTRKGRSRPDWTDVLTAAYLTAEYVEAGRTAEGIAAEIGCGHTTVLRALRRHDLPVRPTRRGQGGLPVYTDIDHASAPTDLEVSERHGEAVQTTVTSARRRVGLTRDMGRPRRHRWPDWAEIEPLLAEGLTVAEVARRLGVADHTVRRQVADRRQDA